MQFHEVFEKGLTYSRFLDQYASPDQRRRWDAVYNVATLTDDQHTLIQSFPRDVEVLVLAGTWCGDCVNQCPIFERFAEQSGRLAIRYFDRDDNPQLGEVLSTCGAARVPSVLFLSEDNHVCGRFGDRTLSKYRRMASELSGAACATGIVPAGDELLPLVIQEWLNEFERIQWMLRTSGRLRQLHGD